MASGFGWLTAVHLAVASFVRLHPHGQMYSACDLRSYVVRYRTGRYRVWFIS